MSFEELEAQERRASRDDRVAAWQAALYAERALSLAKGEETALACEWPVRWNTGAPLPLSG